MKKTDRRTVTRKEGQQENAPFKEQRKEHSRQADRGPGSGGKD